MKQDYIEIAVNKNKISVVNTEAYVSGSINVNHIKIDLDEFWEGLSVYPTFKIKGDVTSLNPEQIVDDIITIPAGAFNTKYENNTLYFGLYGIDGNGSTVLVTEYYPLGKLRKGVILSDEELDPSGDLRKDIENIKSDLKTETMRATSAENELALSQRSLFQSFNILQQDVNNIESLIPNQATHDNQLADKNFVNSSISTNTANYISNNGEPFTSVEQLNSYTGRKTNNDYAFVTGIDESGNTFFDRYKCRTDNTGWYEWAKEYRLNNSSFTAEQWEAISSGITASKVAQIDNKVTKTTQNYKIYGTNASGQPQLYSQSSATANAYSIPLRNANGQIVAADPTADNQCATKKYADDMFRGKEYLRESYDEPFGFVLKDCALGPIAKIDGKITLETYADMSKVQLTSFGISVYDEDGTYLGTISWVDLFKKIKS